MGKRRRLAGGAFEFELGSRGIGEWGSSLVVGRFVLSFCASDTREGREGRVKRRRRMLPVGVGGPVVLRRFCSREVNVGTSAKNGLSRGEAAVAVAVCGWALV